MAKRGPSRFKEREVSRVVRAARQAGGVEHVEAVTQAAREREEDERRGAGESYGGHVSTYVEFAGMRQARDAVVGHIHRCRSIEPRRTRRTQSYRWVVQPRRTRTRSRLSPG